MKKLRPSRISWKGTVDPTPPLKNERRWRILIELQDSLLVKQTYLHQVAVERSGLRWCMPTCATSGKFYGTVDALCCKASLRLQIRDTISFAKLMPSYLPSGPGRRWVWMRKNSKWSNKNPNKTCPYAACSTVSCPLCFSLRYIWGFPKMVGFPNNHGFSY